MLAESERKRREMKRLLPIVAPAMIMVLTFSSCTTSAIQPSSPARLSSPAQQSSLTQPPSSTLIKTTFRVGDVNHDGAVDMGDVIKVERIILGFDPPIEGADVNGDGGVDVADILQIERIMLGQNQ